MNITENPLDDEMLASIRDCASDAAALLQLDTSTESAIKIVESVDACVYELQKGRGPKLEVDDDPAMVLGSLWGEQLCTKLGWQWAAVTFLDQEDSQAVGVFSPDRSLAIYPFHFVFGCLENQAPVTIALAFNMLVDGSKIPELPPGGFENVMDNVHHIVPRD